MNSKLNVEDPALMISIYGFSLFIVLPFHNNPDNFLLKINVARV